MRMLVSIRLEAVKKRKRPAMLFFLRDILHIPLVCFVILIVALGAAL